MKFNFGLNIVDFKCSGNQQAEKNTVPNGMEKIQIEMLIINPYLSGGNPSRSNFLEFITAKWLSAEPGHQECLFYAKSNQ